MKKKLTRNLQEIDIEMYSAHNEGKSVLSERFIRTLKNKIYKHMTAISKYMCFDVLNEIVDEYNNTCHKTIKIKPVDVKSDYFGEYNEQSNEKYLKFKVGHSVRISKYLMLMVIFQTLNHLNIKQT